MAKLDFVADIAACIKSLKKGSRYGQGRQSQGLKKKLHFETDFQKSRRYPLHRSGIVALKCNFCHIFTNAKIKRNVQIPISQNRVWLSKSDLQRSHGVCPPNDSTHCLRADALPHPAPQSASLIRGSRRSVACFGCSLFGLVWCGSRQNAPMGSEMHCSLAQQLAAGPPPVRLVVSSCAPPPSASW